MPHFISHDPTVLEAISAAECLLNAHAALRRDGVWRIPDTPPDLPDSGHARAAFNGAVLSFVELIAEAVEQRLKRRAQIEDASAKLKLAAESAKIA